MTNDSFIHVGGWDSIKLLENNVLFALCIIAAVLHGLLWFQLFIQKRKFDLTFLFSVGYVFSDIFLILSYFIQYGIRIRSWMPIISSLCYFEAYSMFYFNLFESFCLTALNTCRYWQIVRNQNAYTTHRRFLIISFISVMFLILANLIIQDRLGWCVLSEIPGSSCNLSYTNIPVRVWNLTVAFITPILISFFMLFRALCYLKNTNAQQIIMRHNHHSQLIVNSFIFYSIWFILWAPSVVVTYLDVDDTNELIGYVVPVASMIETLCDPIIIVFLDKRFAQTWKRSFRWIKHQLGCLTQIKVHPAIELPNTRQTNIRGLVQK